MSFLGRTRVVAPEAVSAVACAHCGAGLAPGQDRFCCTGCEGAHALVAGLGLSSFYARYGRLLRSSLTLEPGADKGG